MTNKTQGRPPKGDQEAIEQAQQRIRDAGDIDALRTAQAVLLPLLGLSLDEAAAVIGKSRFWVSRTRNAALAGKPPPKSHGGRRTALVPADEELVPAADTVPVAQLDGKGQDYEYEPCGPAGWCSAAFPAH